jgi:hypothetical protein
MVSPGPYEYHATKYPNGKYNGRPYVYAPNAAEPYRHVCELFTEPPETDSNGHLLAASWEMRATLGKALEFALGHPDRTPDWHAERQAVVALIEKTLKKANGLTDKLYDRR